MSAPGGHSWALSAIGISLAACSLLNDLDELEADRVAYGAGGSGADGGNPSDAAAGKAGTSQGGASGVDATSDAPLAGSCESFCDNLATPGCPGQDSATCLTECEAQLTDPKCASQASSLLRCMSTLQAACDANGDATFDQNALVESCGSQAVAWAGCTACDPTSADDTCQSCSKQQCCAQRKAYWSDPDVLLFGQCSNDCNQDTSCLDNCAAEYPSVLANSQALAACESANCATACG